MATIRVIVFFVFMGLMVSQAHGVEHTLRWTHPGNANGFTMESGATENWLVPIISTDLGDVQPVLGVYRVTVEIGDLPAYVRLRAYNDLGQSDYSNEKRFAIPEPPVWMMSMFALFTLGWLSR